MEGFCLISVHSEVFSACVPQISVLEVESDFVD